jgi:hypothetical protein
MKKAAKTVNLTDDKMVLTMVAISAALWELEMDG